MPPQRGKRRGRGGKGRKGKKVRFVAVGPLAQRLIEDYLDAAGHRADLEGPLFRPVKNNSTGLLAKSLNPQSLYESIVLHYAKKVGITSDTHGFCVHSLRATAATNSLQNGADIAEDNPGAADVPILGALSGGPYESEVRMANQLVSKFVFRQRLPLLGDKAFDAIAIKETYRHAIRDPEREKSARRQKRYGRKRTLIEGLFGNIKEKSTSHIRVFQQRIAEVYGLLRLALYNMYLLVTLEREGFVGWVIFRTGSRRAGVKEGLVAEAMLSDWLILFLFSR
jgi:hypothetical protein